MSAVLPVLTADETAEVLPALPAFSPALPRNLPELSAALAPFFEESHTLPATHIFTLRKATISWHTVVFNNLRVFRPALAHVRLEADYTDSYLFKQWLAPKAAADGPIALVHDQWTRENYYHWMIDSLPRLLVLRQQHPEATLLMPAPVPDYVRKTAALLGFERLFLLAESQVLPVRCLLVPERAAPPGLQNPQLLRQVRAELVRGLHPAGALPVPSRRIYASRARQHTRRLSNEAAATALLARHGFETVHFEDLTFAQQVALMLETAVLVGVHGANLTNLLFLQPGAQVMELMNEDKLVKLGNKDFENLIYFRMSSCLGLPYCAVPCQTAAGQEVSNNADMTLNLEELQRVLSRLPHPAGVAIEGDGRAPGESWRRTAE